MSKVTPNTQAKIADNSLPNRQRTSLTDRIASVADADGWPIIKLSAPDVLEMYCAVTKDRAAELAALLIEWSKS